MPTDKPYNVESQPSTNSDVLTDEESPKSWFTIGYPEFRDPISRERVLASLTPSQIFATYGLKAKSRGQNFRLDYCPQCRTKSSREAIVVYLGHTGWNYTHHGGGEICYGDLFSFIAACEGWDAAKDFPRVLERAAAIAGVTETITPATVNAVAMYEAEQAYKLALRAAMPETWADLPRTSVSGERYLRGRGLDPDLLRDVVRYDWRSFPALALHALDGDERIVGIQFRNTDDGEPKTPMRPGSTSRESALVGRLSEIQQGGTAVVCEGLIDSLTAVQALSGCVVFGAAGAGQLDVVATIVAERVAELRGRMLLVPHRDDPGQRAGQFAINGAEAMGLVLNESLMVVDVSPQKDLNDAWCAGRRSWS